MSLKDYVMGGGFHLEVTEPFTRQRRRSVTDPYDPDNTTFSDWNDPETLSVRGVLHTQTSVEQSGDATRSEIISTAQFVCQDTAIDIRRGDRLKAADGRTWTVVGFPARDQNAFTGWRPTLVAALEEVIG